MYPPGRRVANADRPTAGVIDHVEDGVFYVYWDDNPTVLAAENLSSIRPIESLPGPSAGDDPVHAAMLRHARNAGAAVTALEIIRREANRALANRPSAEVTYETRALDYIEKFSDDVLSHVLPA